MKLLDGETFYSWCYEKSKLVGSDLLLKTKNFLKRNRHWLNLLALVNSDLKALKLIYILVFLAQV
ncbi:Bromodomain adjacent to zinc finger domain protein 2B [Bienertia sinuspersici]